MKKILLSIGILLTILSSNLNSQDHTIDWGRYNTKKGGKSSRFYLVGLHQNHYYMMMNPQGEPTVLKYTLRHKLVSRTAIGEKLHMQRIDFLKIMRMRDNVHAYFHGVTTIGTQKVFISEMKDGNFGELREVYTHQYVPPKRQSKGADIGLKSPSNIHVSADGSHAAYLKKNPVSAKKSNGECAIVLLNADMNVVWDKTQELPYKSDQFRIIQTVVGNDGGVYALAKIGDRNRFKASTRFEFKLFKFAKEEFEEIKLDLGSRFFPADACLHYSDKDQRFTVLGFYKSHPTFTARAHGLYFASGKFDPGFENIQTYRIETTFLKELSLMDFEKYKGLPIDMGIKDVVGFSDGSTSFIAEINYKSSAYGAGTNMPQVQDHYSNQIIIPRFSADGKLINLQKIDKKYKKPQFAAFGSYAYALNKDKIYLIFNCKKRRKELKKMEGENHKSWTYTDLVILDEKGDIEYNKTLFSSGNVGKYEFVPFLSDYNANTFLIGRIGTDRMMGYPDRKYVFGTLNLNQK